jgi:uncharacterized protein YjbI with pentapeptide repeats
MALEEHLGILQQGVVVWNDWREKNPVRPDLSEAELNGANLSKANLSKANLSKANLSETNLGKADLSEADLNGANLSRANLGKADLSKANLSEADLNGANLSKADLHRADLHRANLDKADLSKANLSEADLNRADLNRADLRGTLLVDTNLCGASLSGSSVYGSSVWDIKVDAQTKQQNLVITPAGEAAITVDNIKVAQFIYLVLNNQEIRDVIDTITSKSVLILGRFTAKRKPVLDAIREELRIRGYLPVLLDFAKPSTRDYSETISTLAHISRFIIVDVTDSRSVFQELAAIVPNLPSVPVLPLMEKESNEYGMLDTFTRYPWVVPTIVYEDASDLNRLLDSVILPKAEATLKRITLR